MMQTTLQSLRFAEVPLELASQGIGASPEAHADAVRENMRVFDARTRDGLIRATVTPRMHGVGFWLVCICHRAGFYRGGPPLRLPSDDEAHAAIAAVRRHIPQLPDLEEDVNAGRHSVAFPMRAFHQ